VNRFALLAVLLLPCAARAAYHNDPLVAAAEAFAEGAALRGDAEKARPKFARAAELYDTVWNRGARSSELALARARAHRLAGSLPRSIAALRDGTAAVPSARELQTELAEARAAVAYPLDGPVGAQCRARDSFTVAARVSVAEAWVLAGGLWLLACACVVRFIMTRGAGWLWTAGAFALALAAFGALWVHDARARRDDRPAHVLLSDALLRTGNASSYPERLDAPLPAGAEVRERSRRGGWVQVELPGGAIGWLPLSALVACAG
jgi:hypothetical protein